MFDYPEEEGVLRRFLASYARLKEKQPQLTDPVFVQAIGYRGRNLIAELRSGKRKIDLKIIYASHRTYPEFFDLTYIYLSKEIPEVKIPSRQGLNYNQRLVDSK